VSRQPLELLNFKVYSRVKGQGHGSFFGVFTATCFSNVAVMGSLDVRLSVCLSVTLVSSDHIH